MKRLLLAALLVLPHLAAEAGVVASGEHPQATTYLTDNQGRCPSGTSQAEMVFKDGSKIMQGCWFERNGLVWTFAAVDTKDHATGVPRDHFTWHAATASASAGWVAASFEEGATVYFDPSTLRRNGDLVKMWSLKDYAKSKPGKIDDFSFASEASRFEYDCLDYSLRLHEASFYSEPMGRGKLLQTATISPPSQWASVPPGSTGMLLLKKACGLK